MKNKDPHLIVFINRSKLYEDDKVTEFLEGPQNPAAKKRYELIKTELENGYLDDILNHLNDYDLEKLSEENKTLIQTIVNEKTADSGRGLIGVAFIQLVIKSICPAQNIRLHKGSNRSKEFSWQDGISMRTLDKDFINKFLRKNDLLRMNNDGSFMTRSLSENYPYSKLYKAKMRGAFDSWIELVDSLENGNLPPKEGLIYLLSLLQAKSESFQKLSLQVLDRAKYINFSDLDEAVHFFENYVNHSSYSARVFEVILHSLMQSLEETDELDGLALVPLSQMRSANKKHGNIGDIELKDGSVLVESWDAKYEKPYLRDELEELRDKLLSHPNVRTAGFVVNRTPDRRKEIINRIKEIQEDTGVDISILSLKEWVRLKTLHLDSKSLRKVLDRWLLALIETLSYKRTKIAPLEEPSEMWLQELEMILEKKTRI